MFGWQINGSKKSGALMLIDISRFPLVYKVDAGVVGLWDHTSRAKYFAEVISPWLVWKMERIGVTLHTGDWVIGHLLVIAT